MENKIEKLELNKLEQTLEESLNQHAKLLYEREYKLEINHPNESVREYYKNLTFEEYCKKYIKYKNSKVLDNLFFGVVKELTEKGITLSLAGYYTEISVYKGWKKVPTSFNAESYDHLINLWRLRSEFLDSAGKIYFDIEWIKMLYETLEGLGERDKYTTRSFIDSCMEEKFCPCIGSIVDINYSHDTPLEVYLTWGTPIYQGYKDLKPAEEYAKEIFERYTWIKKEIPSLIEKVNKLVNKTYENLSNDIKKSGEEWKSRQLGK